MKYQKYNYTTDEELFLYDFTSIGKKGEVKKVVEYSKMNIKDFYNLAFGDFDIETNQINDEIVTNN